MFCIDVEVSLSLVELCVELGVGCRKKCDNIWTVYDEDLENIKNFMLHYCGEYDFSKVYTEV